MARLELKDVSLPTRERANAIIRAVAKYYGFDRIRVLEPGRPWSRAREISWVRHVCVWAVAPELEYAWSAMSAVFRRDHSTLVSSHATVEFEIAEGTDRGKLAASKPWEAK